MTFMTELSLPVDLTELYPSYPKGVYEIVTERVTYEITLKPGSDLAGTVIVNQHDGSVDPPFDGEERINLVSFDLQLGEPAVLVLQTKNSEPSRKEGGPVLAIKMVGKLEKG